MLEYFTFASGKWARHRVYGNWYQWVAGYGWQLVWCVEMMN